MEVKIERNETEERVVFVCDEDEIQKYSQIFESKGIAYIPSKKSEKFRTLYPAEMNRYHKGI